ncbi:hypothetical protein OUZ56_022071 [Daphnia magna]|uniref:Uncharacterized protein n=1 Tax=Daphnia magna TaxID=35525 RepID=A0ABR0AV95_9CRUS|nr:hypothetical protein OUZ56_022071 [Daphnia magna]
MKGPERKNTPGRNSALATQHPILVYLAGSVRPQVAIFGHFGYFQYVWPCGHGLAIFKILLKFLQILKII